MLIFHSPRKVGEVGRVSGSAVRPERMLEAFRELGTDVILVDGDSRQRRAKWDRLKASAPDKMLGVYSELSTMPIALADADHLPRAPMLDATRFAQLRRQGIPVTAFYRDIFWRFPHYAQQVRLSRRIPALAFYHLETRQLVRNTDHIFLPSLRMKPYVPAIRDMANISALPPGGDTRTVVRTPSDGPLRLFYVGGIGGMQYDLSPMLRAVEAVDGVRLTLCCRQAEWEAVRATLGPLRKVDIVHHSGAQLDEHYRSADVFLMWWKMVEYLRFAVPVKLGEAIGWGLPIITNADSEMGDIVEGDRLGWTPGNEHDLAGLLAHLRDNRGELARRQAHVMEVRDRHSWTARARTVLSVLQQHRGKPR